MRIPDGTKLVLFDSVILQIVVVADSTVGTFVAEKISSAHFELAFVSWTVLLSSLGLPFFLGLFFLLHFVPSLSLLSHNSIASPPDRLVFFSSSPHSFLFRRASFWSRLTSPWLFPTSPLSFFSPLPLISLPHSPTLLSSQTPSPFPLTPLTAFQLL